MSLQISVKRCCDLCGMDIKNWKKYKIRAFVKFENDKWGWVKQDICCLCMDKIIKATSQDADKE